MAEMRKNQILKSQKMEQVKNIVISNIRMATWLSSTLTQKNGTHINGEKVSIQPIYAEDCIQIGECFIRMATRRMRLPVVQSLRNPSRSKVRGKSISIMKSTSSRRHGINDLTLGNISTINLKSKLDEKEKTMKKRKMPA